ncbi:SigE family RNA polymerase sigma factor [Actinoallomurus oryzae]|uniref:SigE family RNA polymerase sigma factor n=1 Tax=Actinoallomurus oryzae TaxID=502180 RepID=A0ABP8QI50_9ACTN
MRSSGLVATALPRLPDGHVGALPQDEFHDFVAARRPTLLRAAMLLTADRADAEDLLQSALTKTYLAWERINDRGALDGYVRRTMVNINISWWRRRKLEEYPTDELPDTPIADHTRRSELRDGLDRILDRLPARQRAAVVLRYYEDLTENEIAEALGVSVGTVKSTVSRAMAKLRDEAAGELASLE